MKIGRKHTQGFCIKPDYWRGQAPLLKYWGGGQWPPWFLLHCIGNEASTINRCQLVCLWSCTHYIVCVDLFTIFGQTILFSFSLSPSLPPSLFLSLHHTLTFSHNTTSPFSLSLSLSLRALFSLIFTTPLSGSRLLHSSLQSLWTLRMSMYMYCPLLHLKHRSLGNKSSIILCHECYMYMYMSCVVCMTLYRYVINVYYAVAILVSYVSVHVAKLCHNRNAIKSRAYIPPGYTGTE